MLFGQIPLELAVSLLEASITKGFHHVFEFNHMLSNIKDDQRRRMLKILFSTSRTSEPTSSQATTAVVFRTTHQ